MENKVVIGETIKNKRLSLNLRMDDVAREVGITRSTLFSIESGTGNYSIDSLLHILDYLDLSINLNSNQTSNNRKRATRTNNVLSKKINRFIIMCVEQYALSVNKQSSVIYKALNRRGIIQELIADYEDMHGMSTESLNEYINARLSGGKL